jgi:hypothetical protein
MDEQTPLVEKVFATRYPVVYNAATEIMRALSSVG